MNLIGIGPVPVPIRVIFVVEVFGATAPYLFDVNCRVFLHSKFKHNFERFFQQREIRRNCKYNFGSLCRLNRTFTSGV